MYRHGLPKPVLDRPASKHRSIVNFHLFNSSLLSLLVLIRLKSDRAGGTTILREEFYQDETPPRFIPLLFLLLLRERKYFEKNPTLKNCSSIFISNARLDNVNRFKSSNIFLPPCNTRQLLDDTLSSTDAAPPQLSTKPSTPVAFDPSINRRLF